MTVDDLEGSCVQCATPAQIDYEGFETIFERLSDPQCSHLFMDPATTNVDLEVGLLVLRVKLISMFG